MSDPIPLYNENSPNDINVSLIEDADMVYALVDNKEKIQIWPPPSDAWTAKLKKLKQDPTARDIQLRVTTISCDMIAFPIIEKEVIRIKSIVRDGQHKRMI